MTSSDEEIWHLINAAKAVEYGTQRSSMFERAVAFADASGSTSVQIAARTLLTSAYTHGGEPAKALAPFSWLKQKESANPDAFDGGSANNLVWSHKYIADTLLQFPQFSLAQIEEFFADMDAVYRRAGSSMYAVHSLRARYFSHIGDESRAEDSYRAWLTTPRDQFSDCLACDIQARVDWLSERQRDPEAIEPAEAILSGKTTCGEQPRGIMATTALPFLRTNMDARAASVHRSGYEMSRRLRTDVAHIAAHIQFCAVSGNAARGLEILERHLSWIDDAGSPLIDLKFAASAARLLAGLEEQGLGDSAVGGPDSSETVSSLRGAMLARSNGIAARFDERNGTSAVAELAASIVNAPQLRTEMNLGLIA